MKTLFVSLSSSYIHTILAARYLAENSPLPVKILETNVNIPLEKNFESIQNEQPDAVAFSCYIFNIAYTIELIKLIRKNNLPCKIILGGYEAAYNADKYLPYADYILQGEGDFAFGELLIKIRNNAVYIPKVIDAGVVTDLDSIKSPYTDEYLSLCKKSHILYMETCRGCPFSCSYCMSSKTHGVRSFSLPRIFSDFDTVMTYSPPLVKLVDRTFNYDKKRAKTILSFLIEKYGFSGTRFHFEMAPELFDDDLFSCIEKAPKGLFQFEIGVQSYNKETLKIVRRPADTALVDANIARLVSMKNVVVHVDLIAGLPCESKPVFADGFNRLLSLRPNCMQSGFLKILQGSAMAENAQGYVVNDFPPYEIVSSPCMTEEDLAELKDVSEMLDLYYNSERFQKSISFLLDEIKPYTLFLSLSKLFLSLGYEKKTFSATRQCDLLFEFGKSVLPAEKIKVLEECIYDDYILSGNTRKWHRWLKR